LGSAHLGQRFGVIESFSADQLVLREDVGRKRVDFIVGEASAVACQGNRRRMKSKTVVE